MYKLIIMLCLLPSVLQAQLTVQKSSDLHLDSGALMAVSGDIYMADNINGEGVLLLNGTAQQFIDAEGNSLSGLIIDNSQHIGMRSDLRIGRSVMLHNGLLITGRHTLRLEAPAIAQGSELAYIATGRDGWLVKGVEADMDATVIPLGNEKGYAPLLLHSKGSYSQATVQIGARAGPSPQRPGSAKAYLHEYWTVNRKGITGDLTATASLTPVSAEGPGLQPFYWNGSAWQASGLPADWRKRTITVRVPEGNGQIYAMTTGMSSTLAVLPNPVKQTATLLIGSDAESNVLIKVNDSRGRLLLMHRAILQKGNNRVSLDMTSLSKGQYFITVEDGKGTRSARMTKG